MSYDLIDRFLRNNLDDVDYAEYSEALDVLCTPQRQPLTDEEIAKAMLSVRNEYVCSSSTLRRMVRAIEAKHGIGDET